MNCLDITGIDIADPQQSQEYFETGGLERCARLMAETSAAAGLIYGHALGERQELKPDSRVGGQYNDS